MEKNNESRTFSYKFACSSLIGFTLAEVLITMSILGILAAVIIPATVNDTMDRELNTALKGNFATVSQAFKRLIDDNGGSLAYYCPDWGDGSCDDYVGSNKLSQDLMKHLSVIKRCDLVGNISQSACWPSDSRLFNDDTDIMDANLDQAAGVVLNNGASVMVYIRNMCNSNGINAFCGSIYVDVNGKRKPNQFGRDEFAYRITKDGIIPLSPQLTGADDCQTGTNKYAYSNKGLTCAGKYLIQ